MASEFNVKIEGIEEVCALLTQAPADLARRTFAKALTAATVPVVRALNYNVPERTGDLAAHVVTEIAIRADGTGGTAKIGYGSEGWKARLVEFGHRAIGHKPGLKQLAIGRVPAHPFMRPSAEEAAEDAVEAFADSVRESIGSKSIAELKVA